MAAEAPWRVYLREWVAVYISDASGPAGADECWKHFAGTYKGRVREEDRRVRRGYILELRLPNLKGEFKNRDDAVRLSGELASRDPEPECHVVQRGSPEEKSLLGYGRRMLLKPVTGRKGS